MTYRLLFNAKGYEGRVKKIQRLEKKAGNVITGMDLDDRQIIITVENKNK